MPGKDQAPALLHKSLPTYGVTAINEDEGIVEAYVSGIGNKDSVADIIESGAFNKSLTTRKPKGVWSHNWDRPVSKTLEVYEVTAGDPRLPQKMLDAGIGGLYVKTQFNLDTQDGRDAFSWVKFYDDESEWSIGYQVKDSEYDTKAKATRLKEIDLFEYSPVLFGANPLTSTVGVKVAVDEEGNEQVVVKVEGVDEVMSKKIEDAVQAVVTEKAAETESLKDAAAAVDVDEIVSELAEGEEGAEVDADGAKTAEDAEVEPEAEDEPGDEVPAVEGEEEVPADEVEDGANVESEDEGDEGAKSAEDAVEGAPAEPELSQAVEFVKGMLSTTKLTTADAEALKDYIEDRTDYDEKIMVGSWEYVARKLRKALKASHDRWVYIHSIFDSKVVYYFYDWSEDDGGVVYYEASYSVNGDEVTVEEGVEVDVVEVVVAKNAVIDAAYKGHGAEVKSLLKPFVDAAVNAEIIDEDHQKALTEALEVKVGATLSKASKAKLEAAVADLESATKAINDLLGVKDEEEGDIDEKDAESEAEKTAEDTEASDESSEVKGAEGEVETKDAKASQTVSEDGMVVVEAAELAEWKSLMGL